MASFNIDNFLKMNLNVPIIKDDLLDPEKIAENTKIEKPEEEWIWIVGYKGTEKDMTCRKYKFELGKQFDMPEDSKIEICESGFHLCMNLEDVFGYYAIGDNHRFFEVKALVRKSDVMKYGDTKRYYGLVNKIDKLAAKSIEFVRELTVDEILAGTDAANWPDEYKQMALEKGTWMTANIMKKPQLIEMGYSETFSEWLIYKASDYKLNMALVMGSQPGLSMDVKVMAIFME